MVQIKDYAEQNKQLQEDISAYCTRNKELEAQRKLAALEAEEEEEEEEQEVTEDNQTAVEESQVMTVQDVPLSPLGLQLDLLAVPRPPGLSSRSPVLEPAVDEPAILQPPSSLLLHETAESGGTPDIELSGSPLFPDSSGTDLMDGSKADNRTVGEFVDSPQGLSPPEENCELKSPSPTEVLGVSPLTYGAGSTPPNLTTSLPGNNSVPVTEPGTVLSTQSLSQLPANSATIAENCTSGSYIISSATSKLTKQDQELVSPLQGITSSLHHSLNTMTFPQGILKNSNSAQKQSTGNAKDISPSSASVIGPSQNTLATKSRFIVYRVIENLQPLITKKPSRDESGAEMKVSSSMDNIVFKYSKDTDSVNAHIVNEAGSTVHLDVTDSLAGEQAGLVQVQESKLNTIPSESAITGCDVNMNGDDDSGAEMHRTSVKQKVFLDELAKKELEELAELRGPDDFINGDINCDGDGCVTQGEGNSASEAKPAWLKDLQLGVDLSKTLDDDRTPPTLCDEETAPDLSEYSVHA